MKILLSAYTGLGNFVMKTPMIAALRRHYPNAIIDLITGDAFGIADLARHNPHLNHIYLLPMSDTWQQKYRFFVDELLPQKYDYLLLPFDAQPNFLLFGSYIAQIRCRIRHEYIHSSWKNNLFISLQYLLHLSYPTETVALLPAYHEIEKNYDLADRLAQCHLTRQFSTEVPYPTESTTLERFGIEPNQASIVVQCGAANGLFSVKTWNPTRFVSLFEAILEQFPLHNIVLVGDKGDYDSIVKSVYCHFTKNKRVINTAGQTTMGELLKILQHARCVICHDSGVMHLSDALQKPLIALWGPTDYQRTRPLRTSSHLLVSQTPYTNIMYNFATTEAVLAQQGIGHAAMDNISVVQVMGLLADIVG